jgi:hypothetical protein
MSGDEQRRAACQRSSGLDGAALLGGRQSAKVAVGDPVRGAADRGDDGGHPGAGEPQGPASAPGRGARFPVGGARYGPVPEEDGGREEDGDREEGG